MTVEVLFEGLQAMVFDTDFLTLDVAGAVTALIDQHTQHLAAANRRQIAHLHSVLHDLGTGLTSRNLQGQQR